MTTKAFVYIATSLDGFIARLNGDLDWLSIVEQPGEDYGYQKFMDSIDILVMGRNTYEKVLTFGDWPYIHKKVIVLSTRKINIPEELKNKVEAKSATPQELIKWATKEGFNRLYIDGGNTICRFLNDGLINEITISRIPIIIKCQGQGLSRAHA